MDVAFATTGGELVINASKFPISRLNPTPFRKVIGGAESVGQPLLEFPILNLLPAFKGTEEIAGKNLSILLCFLAAISSVPLRAATLQLSWFGT